MKYQLADLNNGPFGDVYDTITDAEAALAEIVKDSLAQAKEEILLQEDGDAEREYREPKVFNDEELAEKAEERIREFHSIVEINDEAEAEAEHRSASIIQRQRSGRFDLYLWGKLHGQYSSLIDAMQDAKVAGEHRAFRMLDAMTSKTDD